MLRSRDFASSRVKPTSSDPLHGVPPVITIGCRMGRIIAGIYIEMWQDLGRQNTLYPQVCNTSRAALRSAATGPSGVESHVAISRGMRASVQTKAGDRAIVVV
jgi:hypothetical protein